MATGGSPVHVQENMAEPVEVSATGGSPIRDQDELLEVSAGGGPSGTVPSALNASQLKGRKQKRKYVVKMLEKKLHILDRQIKKCAEAELTLDEMTSGTSAYLKEDLLKRKFVKTWQSLCELKNVSDEITLEHEEGSNYSGTPYPEINRRVQKILRFDQFPDHFDMCQVIDRCNSKHNLGIAAEEKAHLSKKVFGDVGKMLKKRRRRDFLTHWGSHLTDAVEDKEDPALQDAALLEQIRTSVKEGQAKLEEICESFVCKQEKEYPEGGQTPEGDVCTENEEEDDEGEIVVDVGEEEMNFETADTELRLESSVESGESDTLSPDTGGKALVDDSKTSDSGSDVVDSTLFSDAGEGTVTSSIGGTGITYTTMKGNSSTSNSSEDENQDGVRPTASSDSVICLSDSDEIIVID